MPYTDPFIRFDKTQLINLEYSLSKEYIRANSTGAYCSSTIINCNTRKYHGLLVAEQPQFDNDKHVFISTIDETIIVENQPFHLGIHKYPGIYYPKGHKYLEDFETEPISFLVYKIGNALIIKKILLAQNEDQVYITYQLKEGPSSVRMQLHPFLAFRNYHKLSKANNYVTHHFTPIKNGIKLRMYTGYSELYMQFSKTPEYTPHPEWYYNIEYIEEKVRGYEFLEDLYVPGFFELLLKKNEILAFSASLKEGSPARFLSSFKNEIKKRISRTDLKTCLQNASQQFIISKDEKTKVIAGYHWFGTWGRDTFISLPGLTLINSDTKKCMQVLDTLCQDLKGPLFPNTGIGLQAACNSVDAPLWFFWTLQKLSGKLNNSSIIWKKYGSVMKNILMGYRQGTQFNIKMMENGLIYSGINGMALTWMDAVVEGKPVTPRTGFQVEINALWYNAICFCLALAEKNNDNEFMGAWKELVTKIKTEFINFFWSDEKKYLADYGEGNFRDFSVRPNQLFAVSLPYIMLEDEKSSLVLEKVKNELLTLRGLRSLAPKNKLYIGVYSGDQTSRDKAYHQGTVWPWLLGHFTEAYLKIHGASAIPFLTGIFEGFSEEMKNAGVGTVSEIYEGDPPHRAVGAISQAWSVAELLRMKEMIDNFK